MASVAFALASTPVQAQSTQCHQITGGQAVASGFGVPYDVVYNTNTLLFRANCNPSAGTVDVSIGINDTVYIYELGYWWDGNQWSQFSLQGSNKTGAWYIGNANQTIQIPQAKQAEGAFYVGYICQWKDNNWHCGCQNTACATPSWQLQQILATAGSGSSSSGGSSTSSSGASGFGPAYDANLQKIRSTPLRNTYEDNSRYRNTPMAQIPMQNLFGPRRDYDRRNNPDADATDHETFPAAQDGTMRTVCEFSHFAYDDPIVLPGQPEKAHLHMFFGNTDVNAYSTYDTLFNSGGGTCNGRELNRTGYWAPAVIDQDMNIRIPDRALVYYKAYGSSIGNIRIYPPEMALVSNPAPMRRAGNDSKPFRCIDMYGGSKHGWSERMPNCQGRGDGTMRMEMRVKFQKCWNGRDPSNWRDNFRNSASFWQANCPSSHPIAFPGLEYLLRYPVEAGENSSRWMLSSDVDAATGNLGSGGRGSTFHADWWGAWHETVNRMWVDNCANVRGASCGFGYLDNSGPNSNGPALVYRKNWQRPHKVSGRELFQDICSVSKPLNRPEDLAYCNP